MPLTPSERNQVASYKIQIESYRKDLQNLKDRKKSRSEHFANAIKNTKDPNSKRSYRQSKISEINSIVGQIERKKADIDRIKGYIANLKK
jgi:seryl-tRNA synthetase